MILQELLQAAGDRGHGGYAGEVTPQEAWEYLSVDANAQLVDVRTQAEWAFVGVPDVSPLGKKPALVSWKLYPTYALNERFCESVAASAPGADDVIFFICKTGGRSLDSAVAMTAAGYKHCFNVTHGFEGDLDENNQRGNINGWKASGLPWGQA